jgi:DNA-3-methyladenine glycosylase
VAPPVRGARWPAGFFQRPAELVAREILGARLLAEGPAGPLVARVVETEAYVRGDPASHAFRGPTDRNRSMFGPAGRWYVYRIHQVHCANVVARRGEGVLLRAAEPVLGELPDLSGPGRLARAFGMDRRDDGRSIRTGRVRLAPGESPRERVLVGPRLGISRAKDRQLRFALNGVRSVSLPRPPGFSRSVT